jgi:hypothetical protein
LPVFGPQLGPEQSARKAWAHASIALALCVDPGRFAWMTHAWRKRGASCACAAAGTEAHATSAANQSSQAVSSAPLASKVG